MLTPPCEAPIRNAATEAASAWPALSSEVPGATATWLPEIGHWAGAL